MQIAVKKVDPRAKLPVYFYEGDAGMDLFALVDTVIPAVQRVSVRTGIAMAIPEGYAGLIWDRSGMAAKSGIKSMGGVIDSNYRGEIKVVLHNLSTQPFTIEKGMRIAQMLIQKVEQKQILEVEELDDTIRGEKGFGSTGTK